MRILIASDTYPPDVNGAARFAERLALGLASNGHNILVFAPGRNFKNEREVIGEKLEIYRFKSIRLKMIHPYFRAVSPVGINEKVRKAVGSFRPDIIHIQHHFTLGRACLHQARKFHIPIIGTNHFMPDNILEYFPPPLRKKTPKLLWRDLLKVYDKLDHVTCPTYAAKKMIEELGLDKDISVISNGIDLNKFRKSKTDDSIFSRFRLQKGLFTFIFVGRLEKDKNIDLVLKASKIALRNVLFQLVVVGKGKDEKKLNALSGKMNLGRRVVFTGEVSDEDLESLLSIADAYVAPGSAELQGISVMEAMANGLPVLALNAVALPELVKDGVNGYLFELNSRSLSEKIIRIRSLDKKKLAAMSKNSLKLIHKHSQPKTIKSFEALYKKVIKTHVISGRRIENRLTTKK